jgi:3-(3-hydroxy-phenyl)propionate hydroxylase
MPDAELHGPNGRPVRLHDLIDDSFVAFHFTDVRRRPAIPARSPPGLKQLVVSRRDAPLDSGVRSRALFDVGDRFRRQVGVADDTMVLVRPDDHIAAIAPMRDGIAEELYRKAVGK